MPPPALSPWPAASGIPPPQEPRTLTSPELVAGVGEDEECVKKNSCEEGP
jgi:hypothetical protein